MTRLFYVGIFCLVTLWTGGVKCEDKSTFITKENQYPTLGQGENFAKFNNPYFLFADKGIRTKGLWGRIRNSVETNEIESEQRPLLVFRPYYLSANSQDALQPPQPDAKSIFAARKRRDVGDVAPKTSDSQSLVRIKRTHHRCRKCESGGGYGVQPVYVQPAVAQPVYTQPVYVKPVVAQPVYTQPTYVKPVVSQPIYTPPVHNTCNTCNQGGHGGYGGGGGSYSYSQSSASSSAGSFGYGK